MKAYDSDKNNKIDFIKKTMLLLPTLIFILSLIVTVLLSIKINRLESDNRALEDQLEQYYQENADYDESSGVFDTKGIDLVKNSSTRSGNEKNSLYKGKKKVYLTFDDGPSIYTNEILDILKEYDVKATFFVVAREDETSKKAYKRIVEEGHTLAMHSYTHRYTEIYKDLESFKKDVKSLQEFLYDITGVWCRIYRFPGGSSNTVSKIAIEECISYLNEEGIVYFDWNGASQDAKSTHMLSVDTLLINSVKDMDQYEEYVLLMHDSATKRSSVDALSKIIEYIKEKGDYEILPITDETEPIQHVTLENAEAD